MSPTHIHLVVTHIPVLGTVFALVLFLFALWRKNEAMKKAALGAFVIVALFAVPAYFTGEPSEHMVEALPGVSDTVLDRHEDAGLIAFVAMSVLGAVALGGLFLFRRGRLVPAWYAVFVVAAAFAVSGLMAWVANLGGQVRHSEIRAETSATAAAKEHKDDD